MASRSSQSEVMPIFFVENWLFLGVFFWLNKFSRPNGRLSPKACIHIWKAMAISYNFSLSGKHFIASYKASDFCWQTILDFPQHLRMTHTKFLTVVVMQGWLLWIDCAFLPEESVAHSLVDWRLLDALRGSPLSSSSNQKELCPLAKWPVYCLSDKAWHFYIQGEIRRPYRMTS